MTSNKGTNISYLNDDILLRTFSINTHMAQDQSSEPDRKGTVNYDDLRLTEANLDEGSFSALFMPLARRTKYHALTMTLRTSQVCRLWRDLLLASSSIWGRLLDLDILSQANDQLRQEVYRRAGHISRLSVKGPNIPFPSRLCSFVFNLIATQWTRLEWVNIYIKTSVNLSVQQSPFWSTITTPAPNLRRFSFIFSRPIANPRMLTREAPGLHELCTSPSSPLHLDSPWLRQLTFLSIDGIGGPTAPYTFPDFLRALSGLSNLETLRLISSRIAEGDYGTYQNVQLPNLRKVDFDDYFTTCFAVLRHISPSKQCAIEIRAGSPHEIPQDPYWEIIEWLEHYLEDRTYNDRLLIDLQPTYASFVDAYPDCYPAPTLSIHLSYTSPDNGPDAMSFFGLLPHAKFAHVKNLWFRVNIPKFADEIGDLLPVSDGFYHSLKSLEVLKTSVQGIFLLHLASASIDEGEEIYIPLPHLQRIRMISPSNEDDKYDLDTVLDPQFVAYIIDLFEKRRRRRRPIKQLDVRECSVDLRGLDICKNLKVTWMRAEHRADGKRGEYICGSGNSAILNIEGE